MARSLVSWLRNRPDLPPALLLGAGFLLRVWTSSGTFLNPDEALHLLTAHTDSFARAYQASLDTAHPPLLILVLYFWRALGNSEFVVRLPSILAGTVFCWLLFRWLTSLFDRSTACLGLIFAAFLPPLVALSSEVRQYALLLCFLAAATYFLEQALAEKSAGRLLLSAAFLYLALLTHYSAFLLLPAVAAYACLRFLSVRPQPRMLAVWAGAQAGALGICLALYFTHLSKLGGSAQPAIHGLASESYLRNSYFRSGHDNPLLFALGKSFGVFQFVFGQLAVGDIAGLVFMAGAVLLLSGKESPRPAESTPRQRGLLLLLPFVLTCGAALMDKYPYGGTRHSAWLVPFALAGVSFTVARLAGQRLGRGVGAAILTVMVCQLFGVPHRPYMRREDQSRGNMSRALDSVRRQVSMGGVILLDFQSNFLFKYYLCPDVIVPAGGPAPAFWAYPCAGYRVIYTGPETTIFTASTFLRRWDEMVRAYGLQPGDTVWVFQGGWDIGLARELENRFPEFQERPPQHFGRNLTLFKLTVGRSTLRDSGHSNQVFLRQEFPAIR
jgi:Dolichyl-phosphate-mannose-protein mannosyltransferase